jgi:hypothetical protein
MRPASITIPGAIDSLEHSTSWARRIILGISGAMLIFAPLAYGAVHPWAYFSLGLIATATSLSLLAYLLYKICARPQATLAIPYPPLWWLAVGLLLLVMSQVCAWPQGLMASLSPRALDIRALGSSYGLAAWLPLSLNPHATLLEALKLFPAVVFFFIVLYTIKTKEQLLGMVGLILAIALFETFYGFWHYRSHLIWGWKNPYNQSGLLGTFINSNHVATLLAMAILLGYGLFLGLKPDSPVRGGDIAGGRWLRQWSLPEYAEPQLRRFLLLFLVLVLGVGLIYTRSRGGMLSLGFGFLLMVLLLLGQRWQKGNFIFIVFLLLSALLFSLILGSNLLSHWLVPNDHYARHRAFKAALVLFREYPWVGSGIGTFGDLFYRYQTGEMRDYYYLYTHSDWLQLLVESGLAGFALVTAGWLVFLTGLVKQWCRRQDTLARGLGLGGIAALGAGSCHALLDFPWHIPAITLIFSGIAAITYITLRYRFSGNEAGFSAPLSISSYFRKTVILVILGLMVVQIAIGVQICYSWLADSAAPMEIDSTRVAPRLGVEDFHRALTFNTKNSKYYLGLAEALEKSGAGGQALAEAEQSLRAAIFYAPANWRYHLKLADFYLRHYQEAPTYRIPVALRELVAAVTLFPQSALLYFRIASALEWAEKYYPGVVPRELRGRQSSYRKQALFLDPSLEKYFTGK